MRGADVAAAVTIAENLSRELDEDYVGLWKLAWHIRRQIADAHDVQVRQLGAAILAGLGPSGVRLGSLSEDSGVFTPWSPQDGVERAMREWETLGRDPNIGEIAWLARER